MRHLGFLMMVNLSIDLLLEQGDITTLPEITVTSWRSALQRFKPTAAQGVQTEFHIEISLLC